MARWQPATSAAIAAAPSSDLNACRIERGVVKRRGPPSWRISAVTAGRPQRCFDFHRQYDHLNPARCQRTTVSGRTIASAPYILGNSRQTPPNITLSVEPNRSLLGLARRSTLICCRSTRISASSATCDRNRSLAIPKINRHKSSIGYQHRAILAQLPARLNLRQGHGR